MHQSKKKKWEALRKLKGPHMILTAYLSTLSKKKRFRSMNAKASESIDNLSRILDAQDLSPSAKCSKQKEGEAVPKVILHKSRDEMFFL